VRGFQPFKRVYKCVKVWLQFFVDLLCSTQESIVSRGLFHTRDEKKKEVCKGEWVLTLSKSVGISGKRLPRADKTLAQAGSERTKGRCLLSGMHLFLVLYNRMRKEVPVSSKIVSFSAILAILDFCARVPKYYSGGTALKNCRGATKNKNRPRQPTIKFTRFLPIHFLPLPAPPNQLGSLEKGRKCHTFSMVPNPFLNSYWLSKLYLVLIFLDISSF